MPRTALVEPGRVREVKKGDEGLDLEIPERRDQLDIAGEGGVIVLPRSRLDPRPLDREPVGARAEACEELEVLRPSVPVIGSDPTPGLWILEATRLLPGGPIVRYPAFDLI